MNMSQGSTFMPQPRVIAIYIGPWIGAPMVSMPSVQALAGKGLEGDRKCRQPDTAKPPDPAREVALIESEALEALAREDGIALDPSQTRRNLVTRNVPLNHLVGREFRVGEVRLRGIRLCEPCEHLESLTRPGVRQGLVPSGRPAVADSLRGRDPRG
jgi:MOSC domain-containing protein YiiM